jgi:hypothetical protein
MERKTFGQVKVILFEEFFFKLWPGVTQPKKPIINPNVTLKKFYSATSEASVSDVISRVCQFLYLVMKRSSFFMMFDLFQKSDPDDAEIGSKRCRPSRHHGSRKS